MEDIFEKKIKRFLPYIVIIAAVYLFLPAVLYAFGNKPVLNQIIYIGVFSLVAFGCNFYYTYKNKTDMFLCFVAPVLYIPSMLLYANIRENLFNSIVYLVSYFICSYLAQLIAEMIAPQSDEEESEQKQDKREHKRHTKKTVPKRISRVQREQHEIQIEEDNSIQMPISFEEEMKSSVQEDDFSDSYNQTDTMDDIDAILAEIRNRSDDY